MAARAHAAASLSPDKMVFSCFSSFKSQCFCTSSLRLSVFKRVYSRTFLLNIGRNKLFKLNSADAEELNDLRLLRRPTQSPTPTPAPRPQWRRLKRRERKQKRGKRGGIQARLAASPHKPAIPSIVLANVRSLDNKLDYIRLLRSSQRNVKDGCVFVSTETWLSDSVPDHAIRLDQLTCYRADRVVVAGGKTRSGGLCVYINDAWCRDAVAVCKYCSPVLEFMVIKCRPFYLPPSLQWQQQDSRQPTLMLFSSLSVFPKIQQHIDFPTRGNNTLDFVYTTQKGAYKAFPLPHLGASDHITVMLMPAYRPLVKVTKPVRKQIQALQDCFDTTDWSMFKQTATYNNTTDLQEYAETVTAYINKCTEDVTVTKTITVIRLGPTIREAKRQYSRGISHHFKDSRDTRSLWRGIQTITDYKPPPQTCDSTISLLNELNTFFARFEVQNSTTAQKTPPPPGDQVMTLSPDSVRRSLSRINARKALGPDNIPGRVLRDCAVELTDVFTDIFNISLNQAVVPTCFKATTIIPVPKKSSPSCFNDYRPVALTPILMKCFERLVMQHIKSFAYRPNCSTDDAIFTPLHSALTHLDKKDSYVRMLFIDFSSAFNTIIPQQLTQKLVQLGLNTSLCNWLLDFLTGRPQAVRVGSNTSGTIFPYTGAPQGCVLSPLLFTLLTHDCTPSHSSNLFIKFADDTTVAGLISKRDETDYRSEVSRLPVWCRDNNLSLNVEKTKEIVVDFRRAHTQHAPLTINGASVERVSSTKFLGVHITEDLSWTNNTTALAKKSQQRLYFLCKLRRARAPAPIMYTFYRGTIGSILTSCITVWFGACNASCQKTLQRIVRAAERIIGVPLPSLQDIYSTRLTKKALCIAADPSHPMQSFFSLLPSGRRLRSSQARTSRLKDSFFHQAVRKLNSLPALPPLPSSAPQTSCTVTPIRPSGS
ncbi:hypothetical protein M9458_058185 [Cirrhinus mrigala]|uniref:Reverse transcriptase domain-containing protein n=1 Tax=Cirrhinus mrigala TaxID=683832 RepID=A0ABD0MB40_CIRMR